MAFSINSIRQFTRNFLDVLLDRLYRRLPTVEADLGIDLSNDVKDLILFISIRHNTFNSSAGITAFAGTLAFLLMVIALIVTAIIQVLIVQTLNLPDIFILPPIIIVGLILLASAIYLVIANLLFVFYIGAMIRFGLRQSRESIYPDEEAKLESYRILFHGYDTDEDIIRIRKDNARSFSKAIFYIFVAAILLLSYLASPSIASTLEFLLNLLPTSELNEIVPIQSSNAVQAADAILPFDLQSLLSVISIEHLLAAAILFLGFLVFLNLKKVAQLSSRSKLMQSPHDEFSFSDEWGNYKVMIQAIFYQLLYGELREEYEMIRGEIVTTAIAGILGVSFGYALLLIISISL